MESRARELATAAGASRLAYGDPAAPQPSKTQAGREPDPPQFPPCERWRVR